MALKKKVSKRQADKLGLTEAPPKPIEKQAVSAQQSDISAIIKETVNEIVAKSAADNAVLVAAIKEIKQPVPEVKVVQNAAAPIKTIKVTNIARDNKGFIKDMDMKVERESLH
jgi:hypothetical protein